MNANLREFEIPFQGLKLGVHNFKFDVGSSFFKNFEESLVGEASFQVDLVFDKRASFFELGFKFAGVLHTECDRCMANINLPVKDEHQLRVKLTNEEIEEDSEVFFLSPEADSLNVAQFVYEFIVLSLPYNKTYACEKDNPRPCDLDILKRLGFEEAKELPKETKNPFEDLKNIFNEN
jgi:uncharacterized protein